MWGMDSVVYPVISNFLDIFYLRFNYQFQLQHYQHTRSFMNSSSNLKMPFSTMSSNFEVISLFIVSSVTLSNQLNSLV